MPRRMRMRLIASIFLLFFVAPSTKSNDVADEEHSTPQTTVVQQSTESELTTNVFQETTTEDSQVLTTLQTTQQTTEVDADSEQSTKQLTDQTTGGTTESYQDDNVAGRNIENLCLTDDPCEGENVHCVAGQGDAECVCDRGFQLEDTERHSCIDVDECLHSPCNSDAHENCINIEGSFACVCQEGYLYNDVEVCEDIDECLTESCDDNQHCVNTEGSYHCSCNRGYQLTNSGSCIDIDECLTELCDDNQHCVNTDGSYHCSCNRGYQLTNSGSCIDINECEDDIDDCHLFENTDCYNTEGTFACLCKEGYIKDSNDICQRINDECQPDFLSNCRYPEGACMVDENGNQICICSPGFTRNETSNLCTNNNACSELRHVCGNTANSHCVDVVPSVSTPDEFYLCECNEGYIKGKTGTCLRGATFRVTLLVLAVNGNDASSLWSVNLHDSTSEQFSKVSNLFCSFFQEYISDDSANMTSCSGLAVERKDSDLKIALKMDVISNSQSLNADTLELIFIDASTLDKDGTLIWKKSNGDFIVVSSSSFDVQLTDDISCSALECFNGGFCIFDERFYEISCRCQEEFEGDRCEKKKTEETTDKNQEENTGNTSQHYPLIIGVSIASLVLLTLFITLCCLLQRSKNPPPLRPQSPLDIPHIVRNPIVRRRPVQKSEVSDQEEPNYDDVRMKILAKTFSRMGYMKTQEHDDDYDQNSSEDSGSLATFDFSVPYQTDGSINV